MSRTGFCVDEVLARLDRNPHIGIVARGGGWLYCFPLGPKARRAFCRNVMSGLSKRRPGLIPLTIELRIRPRAAMSALHRLLQQGISEKRCTWKQFTQALEEA